MKRIYTMTLFLCIVLSLAACSRVDTPPTNPPATDPTQAPTSPTPTEPTAPAQQMIQANKDQILAVPVDFSRIQAINTYQADYKSIILSDADTNPFVAFTVDFDVTSCSVRHVCHVSGKGAEDELKSGYYSYVEAQVEDNKIIVPVDFWFTGGFMIQRYDMISYTVSIKDTAGVSHSYYFRVDYSSFEKLQGGVLSVVGVKKDGLIFNINGVGYVYVKTALEVEPSTQVLIEYYTSDLKQETGTFTDADGNEQEYTYVLSRTTTLYSNISSAPKE